jgi:hypothetical protein
MTSIFDEYRKFAGTKVLADQEVGNTGNCIHHVDANDLCLVLLVYRDF